VQLQEPHKGTRTRHNLIRSSSPTHRPNSICLCPIAMKIGCSPKIQWETATPRDPRSFSIRDSRRVRARMQQRWEPENTDHQSEPEKLVGLPDDPRNFQDQNSWSLNQQPWTRAVHRFSLAFAVNSGHNLRSCSIGCFGPLCSNGSCSRILKILF
jgi:hypothetical protein